MVEQHLMGLNIITVGYHYQSLFCSFIMIICSVRNLECKFAQFGKLSNQVPISHSQPNKKEGKRKNINNEDHF